MADFGRVLVLSDGFMFLIDSLLIQPLKKLSFLKSVTVISRRIRSGDTESFDFSENLSGFVESESTSQRFLMKLGSGIRANDAKAQEFEHLREGNRMFSIAAAKKLVLVEFQLVSVDGMGVRKIDRSGGVSHTVGILLGLATSEIGSAITKTSPKTREEQKESWRVSDERDGDGNGSSEAFIVGRQADLQSLQLRFHLSHGSFFLISPFGCSENTGKTE